MRESITSFFGEYAAILVFLHIVSAVIWVGGMIAVRVAVHPSLQAIEDANVKLGRTLQIVGRLFNLVIPFIIILIFTATVMAVGLGFKGSELYWLVHVKEGIWMLMTINFIYMYIKRSKAQRLYATGDLAGAKKHVMHFPNLLLPINIVLGLAAIFAGVILRGY